MASVGTLSGNGTRSLYYYMAGVKKGHSLSDAYATIQGSVVNIAGAPYATIEKLTLLSINAMKLNVNK